MTSDTSLPGEHQLQPRGRQHPGPALSHDGILKEKDHKNWSLGSGNHALQRGEPGEAPALQRSAYPQVPSSLGGRMPSSETTHQLQGGRVCSSKTPCQPRKGAHRGGQRQPAFCLPWTELQQRPMSRGGRGEGKADTAFAKPQVLEAPLRRVRVRPLTLSCARALLPDFLSISSSYFDVEFRVLPVHSRSLLFISVLPCVTHLASTPSPSAAQGCRDNT